MMSRISSFALGVVASFLLAGAEAETQSANFSVAPQQPLKLNSYYTCNGERLAVIRCASDSDDAYCSVQYPDRKGPATKGMTPELAEKRGDVIKKLQACGALPSSRPSAEPRAQPSTQSTNPNDSVAAVHLSQGDKHREEKNYVRAIHRYEQAILLSPSLWQAHYGLAWAYFNQERYELALTPLKRARGLEPDNQGILQLLGSCHEFVVRSAARKATLTQTDLKHYHDALEAFGESLRLAARAGPSFGGKVLCPDGAVSHWLDL